MTARYAHLSPQHLRGAMQALERRAWPRDRRLGLPGTYPRPDQGLV